MPQNSFSTSALIEAPPRDVYDVIADYRKGHPSILPKPPFVSLEVEGGGRGAGTVILVRMRVLGRDDSFRSVVSEPEPGRVLVETNDNGTTTTFTVEPREEGRHSYVTFRTEMTRGGVRGALERWLLPRLMRPVYLRELAQLAAVVAASSAGRADGGSGPGDASAATPPPP
jgi:hypothetical protein